MKNQNRRFIAMFVALVMMFSAIAATSTAAMSQEIPQGNAQAAYEEEILTASLGPKVGMYGFEDEYALTDPKAIVNIVVEFVTPAAVAMKIMADRGIAGYSAGGVSFERQALEGHAKFLEQLAYLNVNINRSLRGAPPKGQSQSGPEIEIYGEHHILFNGAFISVSADLVPAISKLPEVFAICPDAPGGTDAIMHPASGYSPIDDGTVSDVPWAPIGHNDQARQLLQIHVINGPVDQGGLGLKGEGVKVGVIDTGVDYNHPVMAPYRDPDTGKIRGSNHVVPDPDGNGPNEVMDRQGHGTHVSGTVIAMAPAVELWQFKCMYRNSSGGGAFDTSTWVINACEAAYVNNMDIVNLSLATNARWDYLAHAYSYMAMDGIVVCVAGMNPGSLYGRICPQAGISALSIFVANSRMGGTGTAVDDINSSSGRGPTPNSYRIGPDIAAPGTSIRSCTPGNTYGDWTGTSMATPVIAGVSALMMQKFPGISANDIKIRLMNSARPLTVAGFNDVHISGAGFVQPMKALTSESYVATSHKIEYPTIPRFVDGSAEPVNGYRVDTAEMGGFSFGSLQGGYPRMFTSVNVLLPSNIYTIPATIYNNSSTELTYTIEEQFLNNPGNAMTLTFSSRSVTVPAYGEGVFTATVTVGGFVAKANYQGAITVKCGSETVARLPFSLVNDGWSVSHGNTDFANNGSDVTVPAAKVSFNMGGTVSNPVTPAAVDPINVNAGKLLLDFILNNHDSFSAEYGIFPADGVPVRPGFIFEGWYLDEDFTRELSVDTVMPTGPVTIYAYWEEAGDPEVRSVEIFPKADQFGPNQAGQFTAVVRTIGGAPRDVTWSVSGANSPSTYITNEGYVFIGADETADELIVTVRSLFDPSKYDTARITVAPRPDGVVSVVVEPTDGTVLQTRKYAFAATVTTRGNVDPSVIWTVSGNSSPSTVMNDNVLTLASNETVGNVLTVTARSTVDPTKFSTAVVTVGPFAWRWQQWVNGGGTPANVRAALEVAKPGDIFFWNGQPPTFSLANFPGGVVIPDGVILRFRGVNPTPAVGVITVYGDGSLQNGNVADAAGNNPHPPGITNITTNITFKTWPEPIVPLKISVDVDPSYAEARPGDMLRLTQVVTTKHAGNAVTWEVSGNTSPLTYAADGWLFVGVDERAPYVDVTVRSAFDSSKYATARVNLTPRLPVTITLAKTGNGTIDPAEGSYEYLFGNPVNLVAYPDHGFELEGWFGLDGEIVSAANPYSFLASGDISLEARFRVKMVTITLTNDGNGTATGGGTFVYETPVTIVATPNPGYEFEGWYVRGVKQETWGATHNFLAEDSMTVQARFVGVPLTITVNSGPNGSVSPSGPISVRYDDSVTLRATPDIGYELDGWYVADVKIEGAGPVYTFTATASITIEARFRKIPLVINVTNDGHGTTNPSGAVHVEYGDEVILRAAAVTPGYEFDGWFVGIQRVSSSPLYVFTATQNLSIEARFKKTQLLITVSSDDNGWTDPSGTLLVLYGDTVTLAATVVTPGYVFDGWYVNNIKIDSSNPYTFIATASIAIQARFKLASGFICGDVNDDGVVDMLDAMILSRYVAGIPVSELPGGYINLRAADVNDDGEVNMLDAMILQRHIAGWPGYEVLPYRP